MFTFPYRSSMPLGCSTLESPPTPTNQCLKLSLYTQIQYNLNPLLLTNMSGNVPPKQQRLRTRFTTLPRAVVVGDKDTHDVLEIPHRAAVLAALWVCQKKQVPCSLKDLENYFNIRTSASSRVLASSRARTLGNSNGWMICAHQARE
jgi:hypothetical protein